MTDAKEIANAFGGENLPTSFNPAALMASAAKLPRTSANPFLSFADGEWTYGASHDECEKDALWAVDPRSFGNGLMEWCDGKPGGEVYVPMGTPFSENDVHFKHDPDHPKWALSSQIGCTLKCITGEDEGLLVLYKTSTKGGVDVLASLAEEIGKAALGEEPDFYVPVLTLEFSSYRHKKYGKNYVPVLKVQTWDDMDLTRTLGERIDEDEPAPEPEKKSRGTSKRATKAAAKKVEKEDVADASEAEDAPPARRRRR